MALSDLTKVAVIKAIEEFDQIGRHAFLEKYGFRRSRNYILLYEERSYDSKAIAGAAHGYLPGQESLSSEDFSGGAATVQKILEKLGFLVSIKTLDFPPAPGNVLGNDEIGRCFLVGNMGGMRRSNTRNVLVLISDPFKGLYVDRWEGRVIHYTGMGQTGDQSLSHSQNRTLSESINNGIQIHLLEALEPKKYTYAGLVKLVAEPYQDEQIDSEGNVRNVWMFPLELKTGGIAPTLTEVQAREIEKNQEKEARKLSLEELRKRASIAKKKPSVRNTQSTAYIRDAAVSDYAKRCANGICELCEKPAPFQNIKNEAYLECHHIIWLAQGGEDTIRNTVALCPNCHRKMHIRNESGDIEKLTMLASSRSTRCV